MRTFRGFYICGNTAGIEFPESYLSYESTAAPTTNPLPRDWALARYLCEEHGIIAIPPSAFFEPEAPPPPGYENLLRFAFCKSDEALNEAKRKLFELTRQKA